MRGKYQNEFYWDNVYGHAVELLKKSGRRGGIHLDIGCGYGAVAEEIQKNREMEYIGIDGVDEGLSDLRGRGFEVYQHFFGDQDEDYVFLHKIIGSRSVSSITILDMLEHLQNPEGMFSLLHRIALEYNALLIISVPNVAHKDVAFKLLAGRFDYTETGLLDSTHLSFFTESRLNRIAQKTGWCEVAANDKNMENSDQYFPEDQLFLAKDSVIHLYLEWIMGITDKNSTVYQLVRSYLPVSVPDEDNLPENKARPFLSIITRTQGKRSSCLREVFLCLASQKCTDFEVLVIGHKLDFQAQKQVERIIEDNPEWLREKIRLIKVDSGTRTTPLNVGFSQANGRYISILDDDDVVFDNWVETFYQLYQKHSGRILHSNCVLQNWTPVQTVFSLPTIRAIGSPKAVYRSEFNLLEQFYQNQCPPVSLAFPASAFHDLGIKFDEEMTTTEDWDFLVRTAIVCGVADDKSITSIYRWWVEGESSITEHSRNEWEINYAAIQSKLDRLPIILPKGSASQISKLIKTRNENEENKLSLHVTKSRLYIDTGKGFNEGEMIYQTNKEQNPHYDISYEHLNEYTKIQKFRWDPIEEMEGLFIDSFYAEIRYKNGELRTIWLNDVATNGLVFDDNIWFTTVDPQVIITLPDSGDVIESVRITGDWYCNIPGIYAAQLYHISLIKSLKRFIQKSKRYIKRTLRRIRTK